MGLELLTKIADTYERKARLYPALLALIPVLALAIGVYGFALKIEGALIGLLATFGIFYLVASIAREMGKRLEESLFNEWGGKPSTQILRHRDPTIDSVTKTRYHSFLGKHIGIAFPSPEEEIANPSAADETYVSGVRWLLDKTRDTKTFNLLFQENIAFGFRRNCLGIKPISIAIALGVCVWTLAMCGVITLSGISTPALQTLSAGALGTLGTSLLMVLVWVLFFTRTTVKTSAFAYAEFLVRACDVLPKKR